MTVVVVTPPIEVVTVAEAKAHLRVDHNFEDDLIKGLVAAAVNHLDGPEGWLGRALGPQLLEARGWFSCERTRLEFPPLLEIDSITYEGEDGSRLTADPASYSLDGKELVVTSGSAWVTRPNHRIRYWAGYGRRDPADATKWIAALPPAIRVAVLLYVGAWYENREETAIGVSVNALPSHVGAEALLSPFRIFS